MLAVPNEQEINSLVRLHTCYRENGANRNISSKDQTQRSCLNDLVEHDGVKRRVGRHVHLHSPARQGQDVIPRKSVAQPRCRNGTSLGAHEPAQMLERSYDWNGWHPVMMARAEKAVAIVGLTTWKSQVMKG
jgi:hypothetical protein